MRCTNYSFFPRGFRFLTGKFTGCLALEVLDRSPWSCQKLGMLDRPDPSSVNADGAAPIAWVTLHSLTVPVCSSG